jgi:hypothetical protein
MSLQKEIRELREVITKLVPLLAGRGLTVSQRGAQAYVVANPRTNKPERVNIPSIPDNASPDFIKAIQGFIDHEVAHVLITDFDIYAQPKAYGFKQSERNHPRFKRLVNFHNIWEDTMIEREMVRIFPGSAKNIHELRNHFIAKITKPAVDGAADAKEAFAYLMVVVARALAGHVEFQEYMDREGHWSNPYVKEMVDGLKEETKKALPRLKTTRETLEVALELDRLLYPTQDPPVLHSINPAAGPETGGNEVAIYGENLLHVLRVTFGGTKALAWKPIDPRDAAKSGNMGAALGKQPALLVKAPPGKAGDVVDITVQTESGTATLTAAYSYEQPQQRDQDATIGMPSPGDCDDGDGDSPDKP